MTRLRVVQPDATPEEIAAIVAALASAVEQPVTAEPEAPRDASVWVRTSRLGSRRVVDQRGPWRLSARTPRR